MDKKLRTDGLAGAVSEGTTEYVLPDYQGDVKKILCAEARLVPAGKYLSGENLELSGIVAFDVLYADTEGKLTCASFTSDYEMSLPLGDAPVTDAGATARLGGYSVRLLGPRKFSAKYAVTARPEVTSEVVLTTGGNAWEGHTPEVRKAPLAMHYALMGEGGEREFAEEAVRVSAPADTVEIIRTSGTVAVDESTATAGGVILRGRVILNALVRTPTEPPFRVTKEIPFEEMISVEGAVAGMQSTGTGNCTSVTAHVAADGEDASVVTVDAIAEFSAQIHSNMQTEVVTDGYLTDYETVGNFDTYNYEELCGCVSEPVTLRVQAPKTEGDGEEFRDVFFTLVSLKTESSEIVPEGVRLTGEATVTAVGNTMDEEQKAGFAARRFTAPFEETVKFPLHVEGEPKIECRLMPLDVEVTQDAETMYATITAQAVCVVTGQKQVRRMTDMETGAPVERNRSVVTVYFPEEGDTLWEIAKRYHRSVAAVASDNALDVSVMAGGDAPLNVPKLLIL